MVGLEYGRLAIMAAAVASGCAAQFLPLPLTTSRWVVGALVAAYFIFSGVYQVYVTYLEGDTIARFKSAVSMRALMRGSGGHAALATVVMTARER